MRVRTLGGALGELCPDDSLMVIGISHDYAYCAGPLRRMFVAGDAALVPEPFRRF